MYSFLWLIVAIDIHIAVECAVTAQVIHGENIFILDSRTSAFPNSLLTVENICELDPDQDVNFVPCHLWLKKTWGDTGISGTAFIHWLLRWKHFNPKMYFHF